MMKKLLRKVYRFLFPNVITVRWNPRSQAEYNRISQEAWKDLIRLAEKHQKEREENGT